MRRTLLFKVILCVGLAVGCSRDSKGGGGDGAGNGGEDVALDFMAASRQAAKYVEQNPASYDRLDVKVLWKRIEGMQVQPTENRLMLKGEEKTAINYPQKNVVEVNRARWKTIDEDIKPAFALHECLGLMGIEDKNYEISSELLDADPETLKPLRGRTDILIVIDDSGSMERYQASLSRHIERLWDKIRGRRLDFKIAVITSTAERNGHFVGKTTVITPRTPHGLEVLRENILVGSMGSGTEKFFEPIYQSLNLPENNHFLRPSANLELIFLTDAEDQSPGWDSLTFARYLWGLKGGDVDKISAYGIIPLVPDQGCMLDNGEQIRLKRFLSVVRGDFHDICTLSPQVPEQIGQKIVDHLSIK